MQISFLLAPRLGANGELLPEPLGAWRAWCTCRATFFDETDAIATCGAMQSALGRPGPIVS